MITATPGRKHLQSPGIAVKLTCRYSRFDYPTFRFMPSPFPPTSLSLLLLQISPSQQDSSEMLSVAQLVNLACCETEDGFRGLLGGFPSW